MASEVLKLTAQIIMSHASMSELSSTELVDEIKKAISFYQTEEKGEAPSAVIVSGGTSGMPQMISSLTELLGTEVLIGNPFSKIRTDPETLKKLAPYAPLYTVAVGLAMRED